MARDLSVYHARTRTRGVNPLVYWPTRAVLQPLMMLLFRLGRVGREHIPRAGGVILAPNHRSFLDPWVVGVCLRRPIYFVAKRELFEKRWMGWFLNALGAFPIRRGEARGRPPRSRDRRARRPNRRARHRARPTRVRHPAVQGAGPLRSAAHL